MANHVAASLAPDLAATGSPCINFHAKRWQCLHHPTQEQATKPVPAHTLIGPLIFAAHLVQVVNIASIEPSLRIPS